ncbi:hypothetical protein DFH09DRAFT_1285773 [Mycena vulgaris]|nr:hypothetical protein DFH09DRAFT_1285773 [Mycena vulgaris]
MRHFPREHVRDRRLLLELLRAYKSLHSPGSRERLMCTRSVGSENDSGNQQLDDRHYVEIFDSRRYLYRGGWMDGCIGIERPVFSPLYESESEETLMNVERPPALQLKLKLKPKILYLEDPTRSARLRGMGYLGIWTHEYSALKFTGWSFERKRDVRRCQPPTEWDGTLRRSHSKYLAGFDAGTSVPLPRRPPCVRIRRYREDDARVMWIDACAGGGTCRAQLNDPIRRRDSGVQQIYLEVVQQDGGGSRYTDVMQW